MPYKYKREFSENIKSRKTKKNGEVHAKEPWIVEYGKGASVGSSMSSSSQYTNVHAISRKN